MLLRGRKRIKMEKELETISKKTKNQKKDYTKNQEIYLEQPLIQSKQARKEKVRNDKAKLQEEARLETQKKRRSKAKSKVKTNDHDPGDQY